MVLTITCTWIEPLRKFQWREMFSQQCFNDWVDWRAEGITPGMHCKVFYLAAKNELSYTEPYFSAL